MLELLHQISKIPCVNGGERHFSLFLKKYFSDKGFSVQSLPGNHIYVQKRNAKPNTIVFTPMDSPGFICLYKEDDIAYLSSSSKSFGAIKDFDSVTNEKGITYKLEESKYDKNAFCIKSKEVQIGETLSISSKIELTESKISGRFCSKFACILILIKLADFLTNPNIALCFTAGFHSGTKAECNVLKRMGAKNAILLNAAVIDEIGSDPILALKDGKHFSSKVLSDAFLASCKENGVLVQTIVFDKAITAAERTHAPLVYDILSLALPCRQLYSANENTSGTDFMLRSLTLFLNSNFL